MDSHGLFIYYICGCFTGTEATMHDCLSTIEVIKNDSKITCTKTQQSTMSIILGCILLKYYAYIDEIT